jgi:hypothetical protein
MSRTIAPMAMQQRNADRASDSARSHADGRLGVFATLSSTRAAPDIVAPTLIALQVGTQQFNSSRVGYRETSVGCLRPIVTSI